MPSSTTTVPAGAKASDVPVDMDDRSRTVVIAEPTDCRRDHHVLGAVGATALECPRLASPGRPCAVRARQ